MKYKFIISLAVLLLVLFCSANNYAQGRNRWRGSDNGKISKIDQFEKLKLIEELQLSDEAANKFFLRRKEFKRNQRQISASMDTLIEKIATGVENLRDHKYLSGLNDEYIRLESALQQQRVSYLTDLATILTPEQMAKYLVFEKKFRRELQDLLLKRRGRADSSGNSD